MYMCVWALAQGTHPDQPVVSDRRWVVSPINCRKTSDESK
jgi:hypothetical protein